MSKADQHDIYRIHDERYGSSRPAAGAGTSKEYDNINRPVSAKSKTCSILRLPPFLHAPSFECTSKLCITFLKKNSAYFHIYRMHNTI